MNRLLKRLYWVAFFLSFGFICLLAGFLTTVAQIFPYNFLKSAFVGLGTIDSSDNNSDQDNDLFRYLGEKAESYKPGVTRYDPERAYKGYTLFTSAHTQGAFLIDMQGRIVHRWCLRFRQVWNESAAVKNPAPPERIFLNDAYLYPNGDLLAVYAVTDAVPFGYGIVKMDRDSRPIWSDLRDRMHHFVTVGPDGKIYGIAHELRTTAFPQFQVIRPPILEDFVVVLSPDGRRLKKVSVYQAFAQSRYQGVIGILRDAIGFNDIHVNSVNPMPASFKKIFPLAGPNTVLISCRHLNSIALLDLDAEKIIWLRHGPFIRQHDAEFLPDGDMLLFDNLGDFARGGRSRIIEFQPDPFKIVWQFSGEGIEDLDNQAMGTVQKLPNGNVLYAEALKGRLVEVTLDKKVVWEYHSPFLEGADRRLVGDIFVGHRFGPDRLTFKFDHSTEYSRIDRRNSDRSSKSDVSGQRAGQNG